MKRLLILLAAMAIVLQACTNDNTETPCTHSWQDGACADCGEECSHTWENGTCTNCGMVCTHTWENGTCTNCGMACTHTWENDNCTNCGVKFYDEESNTYTVYTAEGLNTAISNAGISGTVENPAIIKLTADVEVAGTPDESGYVNQALLVDKGVIALDLNGRTITFTDKPFYAIRVDNGATLTINDSSDGKQGKIANAGYANAGYVLNLYNGKLVINGGTFEGDYAVEGWDENSIIEINGGTFIATKDAVRAQASNLTITGGTFTGGRSALSFNSRGTVSVIGGSFYGEKYDVSTAGEVGFLSYNQETGTGPTFPGGLSIYTTEYLGFNLNALLAEGAAYYDADGAKIELDDSAASCNGDVTVKKLTE